MLYQVVIKFSFPTEKLARFNTLMAQIKAFQADCVTINQGKINSEPSGFISQKCYHDEKPPRPCEIIEKWDTPREAQQIGEE